MFDMNEVVQKLVIEKACPGVVGLPEPWPDECGFMTRKGCEECRRHAVLLASKENA